jgi:DNA-binding transcriptional ArsR family regulator
MTASAPMGDPFEALGDPNRSAILELLGSRRRSVGEIADALPISRPAVSRHLRLLKQAGLVVDEAHGTRHIYRLHGKGVEAVETYLTQVWGEAVARFRLMAENTSSTDPRGKRSKPTPTSSGASSRAGIRPGVSATSGTSRATAATPPTSR